MVLANETSIITLTFTNWAVNVFGSYQLTGMMFIFFVLILALLIKIPFPVAVSLCVPLVIILMVMSWLPVLFGTVLIVVLMIVAGVSLVTGLF